MSLGLEQLTPCFQGILPSMFFTCAQDGTPNAAFLSHVDYVDATHVALSFQFFNKSRRNISENPYALIRVIDPDNNQGWALRLKFERSETSGPIFDRMFLRIEAIASYVGLKGIFKLKAADIYLVESVEQVAEEPGRQERWSPRSRRQPDAVFTMKALQELSARMTAAANLDQLLESILSGIKEYFGFSHSMILLAGEKPNTLITIAHRGYPQGGVGSEIQFGEGIIGVVAEAQQPIRISGLIRGMLYAAAAQAPCHRTRLASAGRSAPAGPGEPIEPARCAAGGARRVDRRPLHRKRNAVSLPRRGQEHDRAARRIAGDRDPEHAVKAPDDEPTAAAPIKAPVTAVAEARQHRHRELTYYKNEEVVMLDGEYLIRSLPARILWKLLQAHKREGRAEFTNRELRLDKSLGLPDFKDNLETRLLLLRRRLDEKSPDVRIVPTGRGRFALELGCAIKLVEKGE